mgnify:CR=1 FL=1
MKYKCPACGYQPNKAQAMMETKAKNTQETKSSKSISEIKMRGTNPPDLTVKEKPKTKENAKHAKLNKRATPKRRGPKF